MLTKITHINLYVTRAGILLSSLLGFTCTPQKSEMKRILVVMAHPDDETAFGAALAKQAREGDSVQLVFAVDGKFDTRLISTTPDSLAKIKQDQTICACKQLGINKPLFYSLESLDRKHGSKDGVRDAVEAGNLFKEKLKQTLLALNPDLIITFGPDGEYGHPEHIIVGSLVTELLLREGWVDIYPLYYFGWTKTLEEGGDDWVRYSDDSYFNVRVTYTDEDEQNALQAIQCYTSGFSQQEMTDMMTYEKNRTNELFFRKFMVMHGLTEDF